MTWAVPSVPGGATAVSCVGPSTWTAGAGAPPNRTTAAPARAVPVTVTAVPPAVGPRAGAIAVTDGASAKPQTAPFSVLWNGPPTMAACPSAASATAVPNRADRPPTGSSCSRRVHAPPLRSNTQAAPSVVVSVGAPSSATSPSADRATLEPSCGVPTPAAVSFGPCCTKPLPERTKT